MSPAAWRRFHATLTIAWFAAVIPTVLWWRDSILWVSRAEDESEQ